jgi:uncharacterized membrane protein
MAAQRLYFIDALRAFAILMMLQGHFISGLLDVSSIDENHLLYRIWLYCRGFTAPVFFTITGWVFMFLLQRNPVNGWKNPRIKKGLKRAVELILWGYALRLSLPYFLTSGRITKTFLRPDVLQIIGCGLLFIIIIYLIIHALGVFRPFLLFGVSIAIFVTNPLYGPLTFDALPFFIATYLSKANGAVFYLFPWLGFVSFGAGIAFLMPKKPTHLYFWAMGFLVIGYLFSYHSTTLIYKLSQILSSTLLEQVSYNNTMFIRLGDVLLLFGVFMLLEPLVKQSLWQKIGTKTLSLYIVHYVVLYGSFTSIGLYKFYKQSLSWEVAVVGALCFTVGVTAVVLSYPKHIKPLFGRLKRRLKRLFNILL